MRFFIRALALACPLAVLANPQGGTVTSGSATISESGKVMTIEQSTDKAIINWQRFENTASETIRFQQPSATSLTLNRVVGVDPSTISGALQANGRIFLINPNGIVFSATSQINVGGLVASTLGIADTDFMNGNYRLTQDGGRELSAVVNQGRITVGTGGLVALVAPIVANDGTIVAAAGRVFLVGSRDVTVSLDPHGLVNMVTSVSTTGARLPTIGLPALLETVVNTSSIATANRVERLADGTVFLRGADGIAVNGGTIDTSGGAGQVKIEGVNAVAFGPGSAIRGNQSAVTLRAVKGDVYYTPPAGGTASAASIEGDTITANADSGRIRTTDGRALSLTGATKITLRAQDRIGLGSRSIQVASPRLDIRAERGDVSVYIVGDTTADQIFARASDSLNGTNLVVEATGSIFAGSGFIHLGGRTANIKIAGDAGSTTAAIAIIGPSGLTLDVGGTHYPPEFGVGASFLARLSTQDQLSDTALSQLPAARTGTYSPPVDPPAPAPVPVVPVAPVAPVVPAAPAPAAPATPSNPAEPAPSDGGSASGGTTFGRQDSVFVQSLRYDSAKKDTGAPSSGGLIEIRDSSSNSDSDDKSNSDARRKQRLAQLRARRAARRP